MRSRPLLAIRNNAASRRKYAHKSLFFGDNTCNSRYGSPPKPPKPDIAADASMMSPRSSRLACIGCSSWRFAYCVPSLSCARDAPTLDGRPISNGIAVACGRGWDFNRSLDLQKPAFVRFLRRPAHFEHKVRPIVKTTSSCTCAGMSYAGRRFLMIKDFRYMPAIAGIDARGAICAHIQSLMRRCF